MRSTPGAFEPDGTRARDTTRLPPATLLGLSSPPKSVSGVDVVEDVHDKEVVWGGNLSSHFGHFLVESVGRLWPLLPNEALEGLPVVFRAPRQERFVEDWLAAFGIEPIFLPKHGAVRFRRAFVPEPSWQMGGWIAPEMRDTHLHARRSLEVPAVPRHDVLWLSRSKLQRARVALDECLLEWILDDRVTAVSPETMSLGEQVALLEGSRAVVGVSGSAFHTLLLTRNTPDCLHLCAWPEKSPFVAQHRLLSGTAVFARTLLQAGGVPRVRNEFHPFPGGNRLLIPETLKVLGETLLPGLLDDPRLAAFAEPERPAGRASANLIDTAILDVLREPFSAPARTRLGEMLADDCAAEQLAMAADLRGPDPSRTVRRQ